VTDAYREDLAYIHDAGFSSFARAAGPWLLALLKERGLTSGRAIDLGCGGGVLAHHLAAAGYDVLGIDVSPAMVALARRRVPAGEFRVASALTAELPPCVAVTALGECFNYLFDRGNTDRALTSLFRRVHAAMGPGGVFVFDVATPGRVPGGGPVRKFVEGDDWAVLVESEEDRLARALTRRITSFRRVGEWYRRDHEVHRQRLFEPAELAGRLRGLGFRVRRLRGYGEQRFPRGCAGFLARKA
jgi:SAM-dependent methyltransferase